MLADKGIPRERKCYVRAVSLRLGAASDLSPSSWVALFVAVDGSAPKRTLLGVRWISVDFKNSTRFSNIDGVIRPERQTVAKLQINPPENHPSWREHSSFEFRPSS